MTRIIGTRLPSPAIVIAVLALVAAVVGTAVAGSSAPERAVSKGKVKKIANKQIDKRLPLASADLADGAVSSAKIADGAVSSAKIGGDAVTATKIADNAVGTSDVDGTLNSGDIADGSLQATDLGLVATGSVDAGNIPAHTCANFAILALAGADDGDLILVIPTGGGSGVPTPNFDTSGELVLTGIAHTGEGHIKVCNVSAADIDPPAQTYLAVLVEG